MDYSDKFRFNPHFYELQYILTADDEEPKCMVCDHCTSSQKYCDEKCGAEHWWYGYSHSFYEYNGIKALKRWLDLYNYKYKNEYEDGN